MSISAVMGLAVVHLLAATEPGAAAPPAPGGPAAELGEEVVVVAHYANGVGTSDAASAGTITRQLVEERPILRPGEVLELVPGLVITQHSGAGKANQYFLRGFNLDHGTDFQTTVDGMPVNLRTHAHGQGYTDLNFLVPELIGGVRYFKGPYFASAGAAEIRYVEELSERQATLIGGDYGYGRALLAGSSELAAGHLLYGLELMHEDGPWVHPDDYLRLNAVIRYGGAAGAARYSLTAMAYDGTWNATRAVVPRPVVPRHGLGAGLRRRRRDHGGLPPLAAAGARMEHTVAPRPVAPPRRRRGLLEGALHERGSDPRLDRIGDLGRRDRP
jgi:outer membrane receptor protein involved in Fe transport